MQFYDREKPGGNRPRFSVVIPAWNEAALIGACLDSLAAQDFADAVQVIVVDNNSHDDTAAIAAAHGALVVWEPRTGVCFARDRGLQTALGEIVVSTDADTTFSTTWLRSIDATFRAHPRSVAVAGPCQFAGGPAWARIYPSILFGLVALIARLTGRVLYVSATNLAFKRDALVAYDTRLTQGGDELDVLRRLQRHGCVTFDLHNPTLTSARRLEHGLAYNLIVSLGYYYVLGYWLNRVAGRAVLGTAPAFRPAHPISTRIPSVAKAGGVIILLALVMGATWYGGL